MVSSPEYYHTLNLKRDCEDSSIKSAYRKLALKHHPERNSAPGTKDLFLNIAEAYTVLSDARRKAIYDQFGTKGLKMGVPAREGLLGLNR